MSKYLLKLSQEWYEDDPTFTICNDGKQAAKILARHFIDTEKDYKSKYELYSLSDLTIDDRKTINSLLDIEYEKLSNSTLEKRINFYETMLKLKIEESKLLDNSFGNTNNLFGECPYNLDEIDLEITKLEEIIQKLKDHLNYKESEDLPF